jgi:uncharacterized protein YidB (DUF937 family)
MGLFGNIAGKVAGKVVSQVSGNKRQAAMVEAGIGLIEEYGGLQGMLDKFKAIGLTKEVDSWVSKGPNLPITAKHIEQVMGSETVAKAAKKFDIPGKVICSRLAEYLPGVVDQLTPESKVPKNQASVLMHALSLLKN